jgi:hypothetical protein
MGARATASVSAMPGRVYRSQGRKPRTRRTSTLAKPAGPYMVIQPKPRIREEMKNGHCMAAPKNFRPGMLVRMTTMAIGTAISSVMTVVMTANRIVFHATDPKSASVKSRA